MDVRVEKTDRNTRIWLHLMRLGQALGCHQREDRSFSFCGYQFPVCARCTGVFAGEIGGLVLFICGIRLSFLSIAALLFVMGLDWGIQRIGLLESTNPRRFLTGICGGIGTAFFYTRIFSLILKGIGVI